VVGISGIVADMDLQITEAVSGEIEAMIASDDSPVGIDVKKTHVIIIHTLLQIEERLEKLERLVAGEGT
jgi:hypothetical protein